MFACHYKQTCMSLGWTLAQGHGPGGVEVGVMGAGGGGGEGTGGISPAHCRGQIDLGGG